MVRVPTHRAPTHPGEMLLEEFLKPMNVSQRDLAESIRVPYQRVNELVNRRRGITPATALRFARFFGNSPGFWMNLQMAWDLYHAQQVESDVLSRIHPVELHRSSGSRRTKLRRAGSKSIAVSPVFTRAAAAKK